MQTSRAPQRPAGKRPVSREGVERLVRRQLPSETGRNAWLALLRAHATLMRQMDVDLERETRMPLADFDVLIQLALADGSLRMGELADRTLISRSGMTRRVARLADEGLVSREAADDDARSVVVAITDEGLSRLAEATPVHARDINRLFVQRLDSAELETLERVLSKVIVEDCSFG